MVSIEELREMQYSEIRKLKADLVEKAATLQEEITAINLEAEASLKEEKADIIDQVTALQAELTRMNAETEKVYGKKKLPLVNELLGYQHELQKISIVFKMRALEGEEDIVTSEEELK
jgi:uncharacterized protein YicC (UPF0701 family)